MKKYFSQFLHKSLETFDKGSDRYFVYFLLASLIIHIGFLFTNTSWNLFDLQKSRPKDAKRLQYVTFVPSENLKSLRMAREKKKKIMDQQSKQIVNSSLHGKDVLDANTKFLGKRTQTFERQTIAKNNGSFKDAGKGVANPQDKIAEIEKVKSEKQQVKQVKKSKEIKETKDLTLSNLGAVALKAGQEIKATKKDKIESKAKESQSLDNKLGLKYGDQDLIGFAKNNDFIEDIPLGDMTYLNTVEYKYFGFYERIRKKLEKHWGANLQNKADELFRKGRRLPASENMITSLIVTLDNKGKIVNIKVSSSSGFLELDEAAIESFNKAGPFPNPPHGMMRAGRAEIRWGFVVSS